MLFITPPWRNLFENTLTVQFDHRMVAYALWLLALLHAVDARRAQRGGTARSRWRGAVTLQAALGIVTLLHQAPLALALAHQVMAIVVLTIAVVHAERLSHRGGLSRGSVRGRRHDRRSARGRHCRADAGGTARPTRSTSNSARRWPRVSTSLRGGDAKAVVLTGQGKIFSAGVDLLRCSDGGADYVRQFLPALHQLYDAVFFHPKPVVAAINGHAMAGGCVLACCADRRIMARDGGRIGVTELLVGVPFPALAFEIMRCATPPHYFAERPSAARLIPPRRSRAAGSTISSSRSC